MLSLSLFFTSPVSSRPKNVQRPATLFETIMISEPGLSVFFLLPRDGDLIQELLRFERSNMSRNINEERILEKEDGSVAINIGHFKVATQA